MKKSAHLVLLYGVIILIGGLIGHYKTASTASLYSGLIFGVLLIASSLGIYMKKVWAAYAALLLTLILDGFFTYRYALTGNFMPSGLLSLISLIMLLIQAKLLKKR
jgi:uncharacterized membrane protein (UPF0136 family)